LHLSDANNIALSLGQLSSDQPEAAKLPISFKTSLQQEILAGIVLCQVAWVRSGLGIAMWYVSSECFDRILHGTHSLLLLHVCHKNQPHAHTLSKTHSINNPFSNPQLQHPQLSIEEFLKYLPNFTSESAVPCGVEFLPPTIQDPN